MEIVAEASNGIEAVQTIRSQAPDAVFMDVQMPGLDGFAVLKRLMEKRSNVRMPEVVFATAFDQYAVRAFEVNAIDYLLKPFEERRVALAVDKLRTRRCGSASAVSAETEPDTVPQAGAEERLESLLKLLQEQAQQASRNTAARSLGQGGGAGGAAPAAGRSTRHLFRVDRGRRTISVATPTMEGMSNVRTLEELTDQLDTDTFWRVHRSFVVNIQHIREVVPWFKSSYLLRMDDRSKTEIPVARAQVKRLRELFNL